MENLGNAYNNTGFQTPYTAHLKLNELESTFVEATSDTLRKARSQSKQDLIYLGTSESMQKGFQVYVTDKFGANKSSPKQLDLEPIISSLWNKTKEQVEFQLMEAKDQDEIYDEISWQHQADELIAACLKVGKTGKFFTNRQIKVMLGESLQNNIQKVFHENLREESQEEPQASWYCSIQ